MTVGIYILYFENDDGMYYVGQSVDIESRQKEHTRMLEGAKHHSYKLQAAYTKYKILPTAEVLEITTIAELNAREIAWIKAFDCFNNGFNGTLGGHKIAYGEDNPFAKTSNAVARQIVYDLANTVGPIAFIAEKNNVPKHIVSNIFYGLTHSFLSEDCPIEYSTMRSRVGPTICVPKLSAEMYEEVVIRLGTTDITPLQLSQDMGISKYIIKDISAGRRHRSLEQKYPVEYAKMRAKVGTRRKKPTYIQEGGVLT